MNFYLLPVTCQESTMNSLILSRLCRYGKQPTNFGLSERTVSLQYNAALVKKEKREKNKR